MIRDIDLLSIVLQTPGALAPIVWGQPGIGKSARMRQLAASLDLHLETVIASIRDPSDFGGLPMPENGHGIRLEPPSWAVRLAAKGKGIAFFDEASCAPPAVQAAMLRPILEGAVGDLQLPPTVRFVSAANPPDQAAAGWDLSPPLANRFVHLSWTTPTVDQWTDWLTGDDTAAGKAISINPERWASQFSQAKALIAAFLRRRAHLCEDITKVTGRFPLAYATPRTWECATRLLASCRATGTDEAILPLIAGTLGEAIAIEFCTWLRANDLPDPEELLKNPDLWKPDPKQPDRAFAVCLAVTAAALDGGPDLPKRKRHDRWHACWRVLEKALPLGKELVAISARKLANGKVKPEMGEVSPAVRAIIGQLKDVVVAAGMS